MNKKPKVRAERILAEENLSEDFLRHQPENKEVSGNEIRIARKIYSFLSSFKGNDLTLQEKAHLKGRIADSVRKYNYKKKFQKWSAAAVVLLLLGSTTFMLFQGDQEPEFTRSIQALKNIAENNDTRLIIENGKEVPINQVESEIRYDRKGENIVINSEQNIVQDISPEKIFNTVVVPYGKRTQIILPEGTKIWLNSGSKLVYPAVFDGDARKVYLEGEGIFEVAHNEFAPFFVNTKDLSIKVLGTIFNVSAYPDDQYSSTVLKQGQIEVSNRRTSVFARKKLVLLPGTKAVYHPDEKILEQSQVNPEDYLSWRDGYLIFHSERLDNILKHLGRYYNVNIVIDDPELGKEIFSGSLDMKGTPEDVLGMIVKTTPFKINYRDKTILINSK
jgi:transmembrane sensor